ncbi:uncharacterized protein B0T23DRAFT_431010 [Neurospora hispaniola]|uniref:Uncharacterized protein n=1 Tax=Neurospora hispaniola TaxID=588809 RepID=A0AAJ0I4F6_9PEZI|nr:hypothetical protein B0T23DRAFT_431010 [Neurospora hispaniola]
MSNSSWNIGEVIALSLGVVLIFALCFGFRIWWGRRRDKRRKQQERDGVESSNWSQSIRTMGVKATRKEEETVEDNKEAGMLEDMSEEGMEKVGTVMVVVVVITGQEEEATVAQEVQAR